MQFQVNRKTMRRKCKTSNLWQSHCNPQTIAYPESQPSAMAA
jgi:hypothetical protein